MKKLTKSVILLPKISNRYPTKKVPIMAPGNEENIRIPETYPILSVGTSKNSGSASRKIT